MPLARCKRRAAMGAGGIAPPASAGYRRQGLDALLKGILAAARRDGFQGNAISASNLTPLRMAWKGAVSA